MSVYGRRSRTGDMDSLSKFRDRIMFITGTVEDKIKSIILDHIELTKKQYDEKLCSL